MRFYVYAITFDQECFGLFSTYEAADVDLKRQIAQGGPAWEDCEVERWRVNGSPELVELVEELPATERYIRAIAHREFS